MDFTVLCDDIWGVILSYLDIYTAELLFSGHFPFLAPVFCRAIKNINYNIDVGNLRKLNRKYSEHGSSRLSKCGYLETFICPVNIFDYEARRAILQDFANSACGGGMIRLQHLVLRCDMWDGFGIYDALLTALASGLFHNIRFICFECTANFEIDSQILCRQCPQIAEFFGLSYCDSQKVADGTNYIEWHSLVSLPIVTAISSYVEGVDEYDPVATAIPLDYFNLKYFPKIHRLDFRMCDYDLLLRILISVMSARASVPDRRPDCIFSSASCFDFGQQNAVDNLFEVQQQWSDVMRYYHSNHDSHGSQAETVDVRSLPTSLAISTPRKDVLFQNVFFVNFRELIPSPLLLTFLQAGPNNSRHFNPQNPSSLLFYEQRLCGSKSARVDEAVPRSLQHWLRTCSSNPSSHQSHQQYNGIVLQGPCDDLVLFSYLQNTWSNESLPLSSLIIYMCAAQSHNEFRKCMKILVRLLLSRQLANLSVLHITDTHLAYLLAKKCECGAELSPLICGTCNFLPHLQCLAIQLGSSPSLDTANALVSGLHNSNPVVEWPLVEFVLDEEFEISLMNAAVYLRESRDMISARQSAYREDRTSRTNNTAIYLSRKGYACFKLFDIRSGLA